MSNQVTDVEDKVSTLTMNDAAEADKWLRDNGNFLLLKAAPFRLIFNYNLMKIFQNSQRLLKLTQLGKFLTYFLYSSLITVWTTNSLLTTLLLSY